MLLVYPSYEILTDISPDILQGIERAGRTCYQSQNKITPDSAIQFVKNLIKRGHLSVLEHESISVKLIVDRGILAEISRHRICSLSVESTRYCSYKSHLTFIIPPWNTIQHGQYLSFIFDDDSHTLNEKIWFNSLLMLESNYHDLLANGYSPQQARSILPNSLKTEIIITANLREWMHIFNLRCSKAAHPQMQEIMIPLREEFRKKIPVIFDNIEEDNG